MFDSLKQQYDNNTNNKVLLYKLDVTNPDEWDYVMDQCIKHFDGLDVVFNIAGVLCPNKIQNATIREINLQIDVNVKGVIYGTRAASKCFQQTKTNNNTRNNYYDNNNNKDAINGGHIINFSSMGGLATVSGVTLYAASKFAVRGFSFAASKDLIDENIAVTCFMPDAVQTPMVDLQLNFDDASMAFSGDILSLDEAPSALIIKSS